MDDTPVKYEEGRIDDGPWKPSPVQMYIAGKPGEHVAHLVIDDDESITTTFAGLVFRSINERTTVTLTGLRAVRAFQNVLERAHRMSYPPAVTIMYPATGTSQKKCDVEFYTPATMPSIGLHLNESLDEMEWKR